VQTSEIAIPQFQRLRKHILKTSRHKLFEPGKPVLVAVSGWSCGFDMFSRRKRVNEQLDQWQKEYPRPDIRDNILAALQNVNPAFLPIPPSGAEPPSK